MILSIPHVKLSGHAVSQAFGGYIYRLQTNFQFNEAPNTVTLTIVNESGKYSTPSLGQKIKLDIGDNISFLGKVWEYSVDEENGNNVLTVTFRDNSDILDKIWVGLTNVHAGVPSEEKNFGIQIKCPECVVGNPNGGTQDEKEGNKLIGPIGVKRRVATGNFINGSLMVMGTEQFTQNYCDLPDVDYSFQALISVASKVVNITGGSVGSAIREAFTGSLRSVLNSWCGTLGLSFIWNFQTDVLHIFDYSAGLVLPNFPTDDSVRKRTTRSSLDNTFVQRSISYYKKGAEINSSTKNFNRTYYQETKWRPLTIENIVGTYGGNRNATSFFVSCALAKYYEPFRKFYNMAVAASSSTPQAVNEDMTSYEPSSYNKGALSVKSDYSWTKTSTPWEVLGIKPLVFFSKQNSESIRTMINSADSTILQSISPNGQFMLAYYDEALESKWVNFEQYIADSFMGRYFIKNKLPLGTSTCTKTFFYSSSVEPNPSGQYYTNRYKRSLPFYEAFVEFDIDKQLPKGSFYLVSRDATWDKTVEEFAKELELGGEDAEGEDSFTNYLPKAFALTGGLKNRVQAIITSGNLNIQASELQNKNLWVIFIPSMKDIQNKCQIQISYDGLTVNKQEQLQSNEPIKPKQNNNNECPLLCEESILEPVCKTACPNYAEIEPPSTDFLGPTKNTGHSVLVKFKNKQCRVVGPIDAFYRGYIAIERTCKFVKPKVQQIYGGVGNLIDANVAEVRIVEKDLTQAYEDFTSDQPSVLVGALVKSPSELAGQIAMECNVSNATASKEVSLELNDIRIPGGPEAGLSAVNISIDEAGLTCSVTYRTRPSKCPTPDDVIKKVEAELRNSRFG